MPYSSGRIVHDADAHIMETPTWLRDHADPASATASQPLRYPSGNELRQTGDPEEQLRDLDRRVRPPRRQAPRRDEYRAVEEAEIMQRKNFAATGSFLAEDRPRALDLLGFSSQLVFNTFHNRRLHDWEHARRPRPRRTAPPAPTTAAWSSSASVDARLLPTCYVPLGRLRPRRRRWPTRRSGWARPRCSSRPAARPATRPATSASTRCLGRAPRRPASRSCSTSAAPATSSTRATSATACPIPPDFHGGEENFRSVDYMGIPGPPAQTLATMIFDGVLERFPELRIGVIEQGAIWVPSWMRQMESAFEAFARHEERLQALSLRPSEYVRRQIRFTPYPTEDVGWIIEQAGPEVCLFSSDYPHVEGGRKPLERFEASLGDASDEVRDRFYCDNFLDLMGSAGPPPRCRAIRR